MQTNFWAIGDLHLSLGKLRDFTRFSDAWENHVARLEENWRAQVQEQDVVLLLGDVSWATNERQVQPDLAWLAALPGRKVLVRGNHDRWWVDIHKVRRKLLPPNFHAIQGDCLVVEGVLLCGAQGHYAPNDPFYRPDPPHNRYERELQTLTQAVKMAKRLRQADQPLIIMMHYPPYTTDAQVSAYTGLVEELAPAICLYGHLHHPDEWQVAFHLQEKNGIYYQLVAADFTGMTLQRILTRESTSNAESDHF